MAWTTPATWTVGQIVTATNLNAQLRDNMSDLDSRIAALQAGSDVIAYAETSTGGTVSVSTASTEGSPQDVLSLPATTYPATRVEIVISIGIVNTGNTLGATIGFSLWEGATDLGRFAYYSTPAAAAMSGPMHKGVMLTPTAASHTYKVRAWASGSNASYIVGAGGVAANPKLYVFARRAN